MSRRKTRETILRTEILKTYKIVPSRLPEGPRPPPCIALVQESTSPPVFLKRKPADHPGCLGGHPLSVSLRPFSTRRKDVAAHSISFFGRIAFFMRGQTMKPIFYMRSCRAAPPFLTSRKGGKKRQGAKPPESPGGLPTFFSGKSAGGRTPEPAHTMREPRGPRGPVERGTETIQWPKSPGPQPLFLSSVFMIPPGRFS